MKFVVLLESRNNCNQGCHGTGLIKLQTQSGKGTTSIARQIVCSCCIVTPLSNDPVEALKELAEVIGHTTIEEETLDQLKERIK